MTEEDIASPNASRPRQCGMSADVNSFKRRLFATDRAKTATAVTDTKIHTLPTVPASRINAYCARAYDISLFCFGQGGQSHALANYAAGNLKKERKKELKERETVLWMTRAAKMASWSMDTGVGDGEMHKVGAQ